MAGFGAGKGDKRRPMQISYEQWCKNCEQAGIKNPKYRNTSKRRQRKQPNK